MLRKEINAVFQTKTSGIDIEKNSKTFRFSLFVQYFSKYLKPTWDRKLKRLRHGQACCSGELSSLDNLICKKMPQTDPELSKRLKFSSFLMQFLYNFRAILF